MLCYRDRVGGMGDRGEYRQQMPTGRTRTRVAEPVWYALYPVRHQVELSFFLLWEVFPPGRSVCFVGSLVFCHCW